jgi:hypothetical protein
MRILISYEDSYHLYSDALERAFSALLSSIHRSARKWNSAKSKSMILHSHCPLGLHKVA